MDRLDLALFRSASSLPFLSSVVSFTRLKALRSRSASSRLFLISSLSFAFFFGMVEIATVIEKQEIGVWVSDITVSRDNLDIFKC